MTDKEIIKALETCNAGDCDDCNCKCGSVGDCRDELNKRSLDLINRQKAEIERLKYQVNRLKNYDIERDIALHSWLIAKAKSEAFKEFAEKVDKEFSYCGKCSYGYIRHRIRCILKEMVGEDK